MFTEMEKEIAVWYYLQKVSQGRKWHQTRHLGTAPTVQNNLLLLMLKKLIWNFGIILMTKPLNSHQEFYFLPVKERYKKWPKLSHSYKIAWRTKPQVWIGNPWKLMTKTRTQTVLWKHSNYSLMREQKI